MSSSESEEWLKKVEEISAAVHGLRDGTLDIKDTEHLLDELPGREKRKGKEQREKELQERRRRGKPGKGTSDMYEYWCRACQREFVIKLDKCSNCDGDLISRDERKKELQAKVDVLMDAKRERMKRRQAFYEYKTQKAKRRGGTDYDAWDFWEPDSDEEEEEVKRPDGAEFVAMERDIEMRAARRKAARKEGDQLKTEGNVAFKAKDYRNAVRLYSQAIEKCKDQKSYYTNRAAANLSLKHYNAVIKDCNTVVDIWTYLEDKKRHQKSDSIIFKAFLRRAAAHRAQLNYTAAKDDLDQALEIDSTKAEARRLLRLTEQDLEEAKKAEDIAKQVEIQRQLEIANQDALKLKNNNQAIQDEELKYPTTNKATIPIPTVSDDRFHVIDEACEDLLIFAKNIQDLASGSPNNEGDAKPVEETKIDYEGAEKSLKQLLSLRWSDEHRIYFREQAKGVNSLLVILSRVVPVYPHQRSTSNDQENKGDASAANDVRYVLSVWNSTQSDENDANQADGQQAIRLAQDCLLLLFSACENHHNKSEIVTRKGLKVLLRILGGCYLDQLTWNTLHLLMRMSEDERVREALAETSIASELLTYLLKWIGHSESSRIQAEATLLLSNCAFDKKFKKRLHQLSPPAYTHVLPQIQHQDAELRLASLASLGNMTTDSKVRQLFVSDHENLESLSAEIEKSCQFVMSHSPSGSTFSNEIEVLEKALAIAFNCAIEPTALSPLFQCQYSNSDASLASRLLMLVEDRRTPRTIRERSLGLLQRGTRVSSVRDFLLSSGGIGILLQTLSIIPASLEKVKAHYQANTQVSSNSSSFSSFSSSDASSDASSYAASSSPLPLSMTAYQAACRCLALLVKSSSEGNQIVDWKSVPGSPRLAASSIDDKENRDSNSRPSSSARRSKCKGTSGIDVLVSCLQVPDTQILGNTCLVIGHCAGASGEHLGKLTTAIIPLIQVMKHQDKTCRANAAVACARLSKHPENIKLIRENGGFQLMVQSGALRK